MATAVIETNNLSFSYKSKKVLNNISLYVEEGSLYAFLGHNGAGKTTAIKIMLSLLQSYSGEAKIFNKEIKNNRLNILRQTGALVEQPGLYAHLSGYENLLLRAKLLNIPKRRINDVLETVNMKFAEKQLVSKYSQGMKQRLGIALALLPDPDLLLLDEPTNGLDPDGIKEIRELLIQLCKEEGKTVFVSSHLLDEVEKMATHIGIIKSGTLVYQDTIQNLKVNTGSNVHIDTSNPALAIQVAAGMQLKAALFSGTLVIEDIMPAKTGELNTALVNNGVTVFAIEHNKKSLEQLYFNLSA